MMMIMMVYDGWITNDYVIMLVVIKNKPKLNNSISGGGVGVGVGSGSGSTYEYVKLYIIIILRYNTTIISWRRYCVCNARLSVNIK